MDKKKRIDDRELAAVNGGVNQAENSAVGTAADTLQSGQTFTLAGANKKTIKEYKEYIIPDKK